MQSPWMLTVRCHVNRDPEKILVLVDGAKKLWENIQDRLDRVHADVTVGQGWVPGTGDNTTGLRTVVRLNATLFHGETLYGDHLAVRKLLQSFCTILEHELRKEDPQRNPFGHDPEINIGQLVLRPETS